AGAAVDGAPGAGAAPGGAPVVGVLFGGGPALTEQVREVFLELLHLFVEAEHDRGAVFQVDVDLVKVQQPQGHGAVLGGEPGVLQGAGSGELDDGGLPASLGAVGAAFLGAAPFGDGLASGAVVQEVFEVVAGVVALVTVTLTGALLVFGEGFA